MVVMIMRPENYTYALNRCNPSSCTTEYAPEEKNRPYSRNQSPWPFKPQEAKLTLTDYLVPSDSTSK